MCTCKNRTSMCILEDAVNCFCLLNVCFCEVIDCFILEDFYLQVKCQVRNIKTDDFEMREKLQKLGL